MEYLHLKLFLLISVISIVFAGTIERGCKGSGPPPSRGTTGHDPNGPPEEEDSEGAHEGDMVLTAEQRELLDESDGTGTMSKRKGYKGMTHRWPQKIVPYKLKDSAKPLETKIKAAMKEWEKYTCLKFKPKTGKVSKKVGHDNYVLFDGVPNSVGCSSFIGYTASGGQLLNLTEDCTKNGIGTIIHEIGHAIGFVHEQSRPDRDDFVTIHLENVAGSMEYNFKKFDNGDVSTNNIPYDHASVMHYGSHYASKNDKTTIEVRNLDDRIDMGQRIGLSRYDIKHANIMYECPEVNECETLNPCNNNGVCVDEEGTFRCDCPDGYRGLTCDQGCADDHDDCNFFAGSGDCVGGEFQGWMLINCKKSCGICQPYECKDIEDNCEWGKSQGYCEHTYVDWMQDKCQKTCGFCNYCNPVPCLNGGTCTQAGTAYMCTCAAGYSGKNCEIPEPAEEQPAAPAEETPVVPQQVFPQPLGNGFCVIPCP